MFMTVFPGVEKHKAAFDWKGGLAKGCKKYLHRDPDWWIFIKSDYAENRWAYPWGGLEKGILKYLNVDTSHFKHSFKTNDIVDIDLSDGRWIEIMIEWDDEDIF